MSSSTETRPGHDEVDPHAVALDDAAGSSTPPPAVVADPGGSEGPGAQGPDPEPAVDEPAGSDDPAARPEVTPVLAAEPRSATPRGRATARATGRPARATRSTTERKGSSAVKTTTRSTAAPVARKANAGQAARKATASAESRPGAPSADALSGGLARLLKGVDEQVAAVTALSTRIDDLVTELNASRAEQAARWAALAQLREVAYDAGLGEVLDPRLAASLPSVEQDPYQPLG